MPLSEKDYNNNCRLCIHKGWDDKKGMICELTGIHPSFYGKCKDFSDNPPEEVRPTKPSFKEEQEKRMKQFKAEGTTLIIVSILFFCFSIFLFIASSTMELIHFGITGLLIMLSSIMLFEKGRRRRKGR